MLLDTSGLVRKNKENKMTIFDQEFLREMNFRAKLLKKAEALRKLDNLKYSKLVDKHNVEHGRLYLLPIEKLKALVEEMEKR